MVSCKINEMSEPNSTDKTTLGTNYGKKPILGTYYIKSIWPFVIVFVILLSGFGYFVSRYGYVANIGNTGPSILLLDPGDGRSGSSVTINGNGFAKIDNIVKLIGTVETSVGQLSSPDTFTLQFSVPQLPPGVYQVSVVTGIPGHSESNKKTFTIQ